MYRLGALILGYVLGGIQTAILYSRLKGMDIRQHGSGNAGATNTLRVMGKKAALFVFLGDILKAGVAVLIVKSLYPEQALVAALYAGVGAVIGHSYPLFFGFKGGKGIAVSVGAIFMIDYRIGIIAGLAFLISVFATRIVSISSMMLTASIPIGVVVFYRNQPFFLEALLVSAFLMLVTIYRHRSNIKRLFEGTESRLGQKKMEG